MVDGAETVSETSGRATVDIEHQGNLVAAFVSSGKMKKPFDLEAVFAGPTDDFHGGQLQFFFHPRITIGQTNGLHGSDGRTVQVAGSVEVCKRVDHFISVA